MILFYIRRNQESDWHDFFKVCHIPEKQIERPLAPMENQPGNSYQLLQKLLVLSQELGRVWKHSWDLAAPGFLCPALLILWVYPVGGRMYSTTGLCPLDARGDLHPHRDHQRMSLAIIKCLLVTELPPVENCFPVPTTPSTNGSYQIP